MDYEIVDVRSALTPELSSEIIQFWLSEGALPLTQAQERVTQVLQLVRQRSEDHRPGPIVGLCTGQVIWVQNLHQHFFNYRSFIGRQYRSLGVVKALCRSSFELLNQDYVSGRNREAVGVLLDIENPQLQQRRAAVWTDVCNFTFVGLSPKGNHIRIAYFDGAQI